MLGVANRAHQAESPGGCRSDRRKYSIERSFDSQLRRESQPANSDAVENGYIETLICDVAFAARNVLRVSPSYPNTDCAPSARRPIHSMMRRTSRSSIDELS